MLEVGDATTARYCCALLPVEVGELDTLKCTKPCPRWPIPESEITRAVEHFNNVELPRLYEVEGHYGNDVKRSFREFFHADLDSTQSQRRDWGCCPLAVTGDQTNCVCDAGVLAAAKLLIDRVHDVAVKGKMSDARVWIGEFLLLQARIRPAAAKVMGSYFAAQGAEAPLEGDMRTATMMLSPMRKGHLTSESLQGGCMLRRNPSLIVRLAKWFYARLPVRPIPRPFSPAVFVVRHGGAIAVSRLFELDAAGDEPPLLANRTDSELVQYAASHIGVEGTPLSHSRKTLPVSGMRRKHACAASLSQLSGR
jgi:hypothetical protein